MTIRIKLDIPMIRSIIAAINDCVDARELSWFAGYMASDINDLRLPVSNYLRTEFEELPS